MLLGTDELLFEPVDELETPGRRFRCEVIRGGEERARIRFVDEMPGLEIGGHGRVYLPRERDHSFSCRAVRVWEISADGRECLILLHGPAESTPAREFYRLNVEDRRLFCILGGECCQVLTLSAGGLGISSAQRLRVGAAHEVVLQDGTETAAGRVRVASARALEDGRTCYGFELAPGVGDNTPALGAALARLCVRFQLEHLRDGEPSD